ncbi:hypothetical protein D3C77_608540 [compost metagenome]
MLDSTTVELQDTGPRPLQKLATPVVETTKLFRILVPIHNFEKHLEGTDLIFRPILKNQVAFVLKWIVLTPPRLLERCHFKYALNRQMGIRIVMLFEVARRRPFVWAQSSPERTHEPHAGFHARYAIPRWVLILFLGPRHRHQVSLQ